MDQNETKDLDKAKFLIGAMKQLSTLTKGSDIGQQPVTMSEFIEYVIDSHELLLAAGVEIASLRQQVADLTAKMTYGDAVLNVGELLNGHENDIKALNDRLTNLTHGARAAKKAG